MLLCTHNKHIYGYLRYAHLCCQCCITKKLQSQKWVVMHSSNVNNGLSLRFCAFQLIYWPFKYQNYNLTCCVPGTEEVKSDLLDI